MAADDDIYSGSPRFMAELNKMEAEEAEKWVDLTAMVMGVINFTQAEQDELKAISPIDFYNSGLKLPKSNLQFTLDAMGINDTNRTIPALADLEAAYTAHFKAEAVMSLYRARLELARMFSRQPVSVNSRQAKLTNLAKVTGKFEIIASAFGHYTEWNKVKEAVSIIEALFLTEKI